MLTFQQLTTEKYVHQSMKQQIREIKRARKRHAIHDFTTFLLGLVAIPFAIAIGQQAPKLLSYTASFLESIGILN